MGGVAVSCGSRKRGRSWWATRWSRSARQGIDLQRSILTTVLFAMVAVLATVVSAWVAYDQVRNAMRSDFERRILHVADLAASQIDGGGVGEIAQLGEESGGYLAVQTQLSTLRSTIGLWSASLIDAAGVTLFDAQWEEGIQPMPSALDTLAGEALDVALAGTINVSAPYRHGRLILRAGFAPVRDSNVVVGAVAVEAEAAYLPALDTLGRTLALIALISVVAIGLLATFIVRAAQSGARLERRLSRAENLAAMGRLTATLAHEIKNPLAIIRGSAQRLGKLEPEAQRMADFVVEETDRLAATVTRYLQFAKGDPSLGERGDALAALDATLDLLEGEMQSRNVTVERARGPFESAIVPLDNESLKQVYLNLILNALDAMAEGGRLSIVERERQGRIEIEMRDEGAGIPPEDLKRIGSPFFTTKAQGSGLGLFLTRRLVQTSGGDLTITSQIGQGTTCIVRLPRSRG